MHFSACKKAVSLWKKRTDGGEQRDRSSRRAIQLDSSVQMPFLPGCTFSPSDAKARGTKRTRAVNALGGT
jgi:hypothetical protein